MVPLAILVSPAAFFTAYLLGARMRRSQGARHWPRHPAKVLESSVRQQWIRGGTLYKITVRYEYTVGHRLTLTEVLPSPFGTDRAGYAGRLNAFFRVGATVPVYVDPERPHVAVLLPGIDEREWGFLGVMLAIGVGTPLVIFLR